VEEDKENLKRGDFFADSKLRSILNHARFVPLPKSIHQDPVTGEYRQSIVPLDAPLDFVPKKPPATAEIVASTDNIQKATLAASMQSPPALSFSEMNHVYHEPNVDVDTSDDEHVIHQDAQTFTGAFDVHDDDFDQSSASQFEEDEDDMILDIEGDDDTMGSIPPWKLRLLDEEKRRRVKQTASPPLMIQARNNGKRKHSSSPPLVGEDSLSVPNSHQNENNLPEKKKKKTVRFA